MIANRTLVVRTFAQSTEPCQRETSIPFSIGVGAAAAGNAGTSTSAVRTTAARMRLAARAGRT